MTQGRMQPLWILAKSLVMVIVLTSRKECHFGLTSPGSILSQFGGMTTFAGPGLWKLWDDVRRIIRWREIDGPLWVPDCFQKNIRHISKTCQCNLLRNDKEIPFTVRTHAQRYALSTLFSMRCPSGGLIIPLACTTTVSSWSWWGLCCSLPFWEWASIWCCYLFFLRL